MGNKGIKRSRGDLTFDIVNLIILSVIALIVIYPLYFVVIASISDPTAVNNGQVIFTPRGVTMEGYNKIFKDDRIWTGYRNTIFYTIVGTTINIFLTMMIAYPLSRRKFSGRKPLTLILMITMYFGGGMIPTYLLVKDLHLVDNWMVMVLLSAVSVFNVIIARSSIEGTIPEELYEAASIDGCSHFTFFSKFVLPLSKPIIAVLILYYGINHWNEFMTPLIYLRSEKLYPLQIILRSILLQNTVDGQMAIDVVDQLEAQRAADLIKYGVIIVSTLPALILYPFLQKYFAKGAMIGSVKG